MDFAGLIAGRERSGARVTFRVGADWQHRRTLFGGLVAACAACAIRDVAGPARALRALQVAFVGPVPAGELAVDVDVLREGRAVTQVRAVAHAGDGAGCHVLAVLGDARASALPVSAARRPPARDVDELADVPFIGPPMPGFMRQLRVRWAEGGLPFSGGDTRASRLWLQLRGEPVPAELCAILFADAMPSPIMAAATGRLHAASLAWSLEVLAAGTAPAAGGWWRADTELTASADGYANQRSTIWAPDGAPAAFSHQVVAVYG